MLQGRSLASAAWQALARQKQQALSDAALKDIGLSRGDAWLESERPFWDDPRNS